MNTSPPLAAESDMPTPAVTADAASRWCMRVWLLAGLLALVTIAAFWPAINHDFINYDDPLYVTSNAHVQTGLTWRNVQWAFCHPVVGNWHPVTMLSHMLDCRIYGLEPWGHHLTNVLLHATNTALVFVLLFRLTGTRWRSWIVAALFGLHPLHVESVAWVAERKDVLSTFFGLLCLIAYARYTQLSALRNNGPLNLPTADCYSIEDGRTVAVPSPLPSDGRGEDQGEVRAPGQGESNSQFAIRNPHFYYWLALLLFTLGLMSKPMLVTLPFVMLLLDYWPLQRFNASTVLEKLPFFALSTAMCVITCLVQRQTGMMDSLETVPLGARLGNALISYCRYLGKLFWPTNLAVFYPYPEHNWPIALVLLAALAIAGISAFAYLQRTRHPYLLTGWLWYCGTLVPVIGLVQVGGQAMADRYTYLPSVGIFIVVVCGAYELARCPAFRLPLVAASCIVLILCVGLTRQQLGYWQDNETLYRHALAVTDHNYLAHHNLGIALFKKGEIDQAITQYREAVRLEPDNPEAHYNLGAALAGNGETDEAILEFQKAIQLKPDYAAARVNLGTALAGEGQLGEAISQFREAVRLQPDNAQFRYSLGTVLGVSGQIDEAIVQFQQALRLQPDYPAAQNNLARALQIKNARAH